MPGGKAGLGNENPGVGLWSDTGGRGNMSGRDVALLPEVGRGVSRGARSRIIRQSRGHKVQLSACGARVAFVARLAN